MAQFMRAFNTSLVKRPILTGCATSMVLFGVGDVFAQQAIEKKGSKHDWMRTTRLSFYGGAFFGPLASNWLQFLNRLQFASPTKAIAYKVYLDQFVFTPGVIALFFGSNALLEGKSIDDAKERISEAYVPTLIRNWGVFIPTQIVNFWFIPPHMRFVAVNVVALFWNAYLSSVNAAKEAEIAAEHAHPHSVEEKKTEAGA